MSIQEHFRVYQKCIGAIAWLLVAPSILKSSALVNKPVISGESVILLFLKCEPAGMDTCCMVTERSQVSAPGD